MKEQCERCGMDIDSDNAGDICEESLCPYSIYVDEVYEELDFSDEKSESIYIPDTVP